MVEDLSIGVANGPAEYQFSRIVSILPARDGSVWVLDFTGMSLFTGISTLRRYDSAGRYIATISREGQGPQEFDSPSGLAQLPDGRILPRDNAP